MKLQFLFFVSQLSSVLAWNVDRRCLKEGKLLYGEDVERLEAEIDKLQGYEAREDVDGQQFDLDDLAAFGLGLEEEDVANNLRGSSFSNTTRNLQSGRTFNLKLYWQSGYCWQDEWEERKWCMECRRNCESGDVLEIQKCSKKSSQSFQWQNGKIKVASNNNCLTKSGNSLRLRSCGGSNQGFQGYQSSGGFELKPSGSSQCVTQHHHPKAGEIIELYSCGTAAAAKTNKWNVYWPSSGSDGGDNNNDNDNDNDNNNDNDSDTKTNNNDGGGSGPSLTTRGKACSSSNKCGKCEGDCDSDSDCEGSLQCRQRYGSTALDTVPGCSGTGKKGLDYCY